MQVAILIYCIVTVSGMNLVDMYYFVREDVCADDGQGP